MKEWFKKLNPTVQLIVIGVAGLLVFLIIKNGRNFFKSFMSSSSQFSEQLGFQAGGQTKSFSDSQYSEYADKLYQAMDGPGTYTDDVFAVFNALKNDLDLLALEQKFGNRESSWTAPFGSEYDLGQWLRDDLSSSDISKVNSILSSKGIQKQY